jgi:hypothetical protein
MNFPEAFYLHISGAQRGPYTIPQIDHLLHSGLIAEETLYWREGLEQWQPVTSLVALRKRPKRWVKPVMVLGLMLLLAIPLRIFGPVVLVGWKEANQHSFTDRAAYWRARDIVRTQTSPAGLLVEFAAFARGHVELRAPGEASVELHGTIIEGQGSSRPAVWKVAMRFDAEDKEWSGGPAVEIVAP